MLEDGSSKSAAKERWATLLCTLSASFSISAFLSGDTTGVSLGGGESAGKLRGDAVLTPLEDPTPPLLSVPTCAADARAARRRFSFRRSFSLLVLSGSLSLAAARRSRRRPLEKKFFTVRWWRPSSEAMCCTSPREGFSVTRKMESRARRCRGPILPLLVLVMAAAKTKPQLYVRNASLR